MEEKNTRLLLAVIVIMAAALIVISVAGFGKPKVTGAAVAGQNGGDPGLFFGKGLTFVDDITCKEWLMCFIGWTTPNGTFASPYTMTTVQGSENIAMYQYHGIPMAYAPCVWSYFSLLFYGVPDELPPFDGPEFIPIPPECLVQKDPTITTPPEVTPSETLPEPPFDGGGAPPPL